MTPCFLLFHVLSHPYIPLHFEEIICCVEDLNPYQLSALVAQLVERSPRLQSVVGYPT